MENKCEHCPEKERGDYWFRWFCTLLSGISGIAGAVITGVIVRLLRN